MSRCSLLPAAMLLESRSEIKPSEISPIVFKEWLAKWADVPGPVV